MALPVSPYVAHDDSLAMQADFVYRKTLDFAVDFASNVFRLAIPAKTTIVSVRLRVKVASNGTSPTVKVEDNLGTPLSYIGTADFDPSVAVTAAGAMKNSLMTAETASGGHYYDTAALLVVTAGGSAAPTTGQLVLEVVFSGGYDKPKDMINNWA